MTVRVAPQGNYSQSDVAVLLLAAAESLDLDASVVRTSGILGVEFEVPLEVAERADLIYSSDEELDTVEADALEELEYDEEVAAERSMELPPMTSPFPEPNLGDGSEAPVTEDPEADLDLTPSNPVDGGEVDNPVEPTEQTTADPDEVVEGAPVTDADHAAGMGDGDELTVSGDPEADQADEPVADDPVADDPVADEVEPKALVPSDYTREQLDDLARTAGVVEPEKLPNKQAVADAIATSNQKGDS